MLGVVILNYLTYEETIKCVESILSANNEKIKIYVVDNDSYNESYKVLSEKYNNIDFVQVIKSINNGGYAKGNNIGINESIKDNCDFTIITNNDVIFLPNSLKGMHEFMGKNTNTVILGPQILNEKYEIQKSITIDMVSSLEYIRLHESVRSKKFKQKIVSDEIIKPIKVYNVSGCCFIINNALFKQMGAFDEETFLYNEENIIGIQANKYNFDTFYLPSVKVIHNHGKTAGKESMFVNREFLISAMYYWNKYRNKNNLFLILLWLYFTIRWGVKAIYVEELRKSWSEYFIKTISSLKKELIRKVET